MLENTGFFRNGESVGRDGQKCYPHKENACLWEEMS